MALGEPVVSMAEVHGGDVARAYRVDLGGGGRVFAKTHAVAAARLLLHGGGRTRVVACGGCGRGARSARRVRRRRRRCLALEWIDERPAGPEHRARVRRPTRRAPCRRRAVLRPRGSAHHRQSADCRTNRVRTGRRSTPRTGCCPSPSSPPTAVCSRDARSSQLERLAIVARPVRRPASRRRACTATCGPATDWSMPTATSWLIDPAAHGGHREFDLAMMRLFGGFGHECFGALRGGSSPRRRLGGPGRAASDRAARRARDQVRRRLRGGGDEGDRAVPLSELRPCGRVAWRSSRRRGGCRGGTTPRGRLRRRRTGGP